ncbi:MAG: hypothetical protein KatS3mg043_0620 [Rhodothermaceae bacterium]|nr:MAG: hypothetical protein KatS3mg043_0620 [Rhodothermaceae bacterium]
MLVEDGVLCALLTDRACAETLGLPVTGHARRQDYRHAPLPRMTNLVLAPGAATPADLIAGVRDGLYVRTAGHGTLQPGTGTYTLEVVEGTRIEAGRLTHPVAGVRLEGRLAGALAGIRGVARDGRLETARGICEKAGQTVPVSVGMPTVLVEGMTVVSRSRL